MGLSEGLQNRGPIPPKKRIPVKSGQRLRKVGVRVCGSCLPPLGEWEKGPAPREALATNEDSAVPGLSSAVVCRSPDDSRFSCGTGRTPVRCWFIRVSKKPAEMSVYVQRHAEDIQGSFAPGEPQTGNRPNPHQQSNRYTNCSVHTVGFHPAMKINEQHG